MRPMLAVLLCALGLPFTLSAGEPAPAPKPPPKWAKMDYGPFLAASYDTGKDKDNWALKGVLVALNPAEKAHAVFDTENLRISAAWTGGFMNGAGVVYDSNHHKQPKPVGEIAFTTKQGPGWAAPGGGFTDPRPTKEGPLPKDWMRYNGLYRHGTQTIFSYSVCGVPILERLSFSRDAGAAVFHRTLNIAKRDKPLTVYIAEYPSSEAPSDIGLRIVVYGVDGLKCEWGDKRSQLTIPAGEALNLRISIAKAADDATLINAHKIVAGLPVEALEPLTKGGPAQWTETVTTQGVLGKEEGPYAVDTITLPEANPWNSWMRLGGFDFFADGKSAAISTWSGDVWIVTGIDAGLEKLTWRRFASGLHEPLGLKIVDGLIYTTCRNGIMRLRDLNNDGEADFQEVFNGDVILTPHFHEFALDLQTDTEGNFYFAKGCTPGVGGPGFNRLSEHNGCFFKVSKDGSKLDVVARGLRAPNGIGVSPHTPPILTSGDNEGSWVPSCPINIVRQGGFIGVVDAAESGKPKPEKRDDPLCWLPWNTDNSAGAQVWVTSEKWGPFSGKMLHLSYGKSSLFATAIESDANGPVQCGVSKFPLQFASGIMRGRFNAADGQLYVCGLRGWQTTGARDGCFQRVRYQEKPVHMPITFKTNAKSIEVGFTSPLDGASVADTENLAAWGFNVHWTKNYGSERFSPRDPSKKQGKNDTATPGDVLTIKSAKLLPDGKTVQLELPELQPMTNLIIRFKIKAADGTPIDREFSCTINRIVEGK